MMKIKNRLINFNQVGAHTWVQKLFMIYNTVGRYKIIPDRYNPEEEGKGYVLERIVSINGDISVKHIAHADSVIDLCEKAESDLFDFILLETTKAHNINDYNIAYTMINIIRILDRFIDLIYVKEVAGAKNEDIMYSCTRLREKCVAYLRGYFSITNREGRFIPILINKFKNRDKELKKMVFDIQQSVLLICISNAEKDKDKEIYDIQYELISIVRHIFKLSHDKFEI